MRLFASFLLSACIVCMSWSGAFAKNLYQVTQIPDDVHSQYLTRDGQVLGFEATSGSAVFWSAESGVVSIPAPDGYKWSGVFVSPGGRFLGTAITTDNQVLYLQGQLGSNLSPVSFPTGIPGIGSEQGILAEGLGDGIIGDPGVCPSDNPGDCIIACTDDCPGNVPLPPQFVATAINDDGVIAGSVFIDRQNMIPMRLYPNGKLELMDVNSNANIDPLAVGGLRATWINRRGDALITSTSISCEYSSPFLWTSDGEVLNPAPLSGYEYLVDPVLNDLGEIAGTATKSIFDVVQGFLWKPGYGTVPLELLPGFTSAFVKGLNNHGIAVGQALNVTGSCNLFTGPLFPPQPLPTAVIWQRGGHVIELNTVIKNKRKHHDPSVGSLTNAFVINDAGQILAYGIDKSGAMHYYLLTPKREPDSKVDEQDGE